MTNAFDSDTKEAEELSPPPPFVWRAWAAHSQPVQGMALLAVFFLVPVALIWGGVSLPVVLFAIVCMAITLRNLLLPRWFEMNTHGVEFGIFPRRKKRLPWRDIAKWRIQDDNLLLFPEKTTSPSDAFRILAIPLAGHTSEVESRVRFYMGPPDEGRPREAGVEIIADDAT